MSEALGDLNLLLPGASEDLSQFSKRIFLTSDALTEDCPFLFQLK